MDRNAKPDIHRSEQGVLNRSFDETYQVLAVEALVYNPETGNMDRMTQPGVTTTPVYGINNITSDATYKYFGFETADGQWKIMRKTLADGTFQYAKGDSGYSTAWTDKATQTYANYGDTF